MPQWNQLTLKQKIGVISIIVALVVVLSFTIWFMMTHPVFTRGVRDLSLILLAIGAIVLDIVVIVLLYQTYKLLAFLLNELIPVMKDLRETTGTVRGTANFMTDSFVNPSIDTLSKVAGVRTSLRTFFSGLRDVAQPAPRPRANGSTPQSTPSAPPGAMPGASRPSGEESNVGAQ